MSLRQRSQKGPSAAPTAAEPAPFARERRAPSKSISKGLVGKIHCAAMRIAMFSWETLHSSPVGGVATHVTELAAALARRGHQVHVFTRPGQGLGSVSQIGDVWYHY